MSNCLKYQRFSFLLIFASFIPLILDLKIFISPTHATQYEKIAIAELWSTVEEWKREVVKITPIWDFAYHNSISIEVID